MKFFIETFIWFVITAAVVVWFWGASVEAIGVSLAISLAISFLGGNMFYNQRDEK